MCSSCTYKTHPSPNSMRHCSSMVNVSRTVVLNWPRLSCLGLFSKQDHRLQISILRVYNSKKDIFQSKITIDLPHSSMEFLFGTGGPIEVVKRGRDHGCHHASSRSLFLASVSSHLVPVVSQA